MCGIAGFWGDFDPRLLDGMADELAHRGPDDSGTWHDPGSRVGLAHRRLTILDLTSAGHQPMTTEDETAVITFNGEIFNFWELRAELEGGGSTFRSSCDTEVLLELYRRHGTEMLPRLNGMFAFALWDRKQRSLFLARDGLGVKPLYYAFLKKGFLFGSEIKALIREPDLERSLCPEAIHYYLTYLWCPAPLTGLQSVQKLEPGEALLLSDRQVRRRWYLSDLPISPDITEMDAEEAAEGLRSRLKTAVERQLLADVPVGAFLSGGLDSSAIVSQVKAMHPDMALPCFTIHTNDEGYRKEGFADDLPYARRVAERLGVELHEIEVGPSMTEQLPQMLYALDEPQADLAPLNVLFISQLSRQHGIKVLLSGAGGDDLFTGYPRHFALMQERWWSWLPVAARRLLGTATRHLPQNTPLGRRLATAFRYAHLDPAQRMLAYFFRSDPSMLMQLYQP